MIGTLPCVAMAFMVPPTAFTGRTLNGMATMKAADVDEDDKPQLHLEPLGAIVEFDDGKHDRSVLGIVSSAEAKAKGGARYTVVDSNSVLHSVPGKSIHCSFSPDAKIKKGDPAVQLEAFEKVHELAPTDLGVEAEDLELAWEFFSEEEEKTEWSARAILQAIDETLCRSSIEKYKAFRLLNSDLGHIFFKTLSGGRYKLKSPKAVQASKENWCRAHDELDYCLV